MPRDSFGSVGGAVAAGGLTVVLLDAPRPRPSISFLVLTRAPRGTSQRESQPADDNGTRIYGPAVSLLCRAAPCADASILGVTEFPALTDDQRGDPASVPSRSRVEADRRITTSAGLRGGPGIARCARVLAVFTPLHGVGAPGCRCCARASDVPCGGAGRPVAARSRPWPRQPGAAGGDAMAANWPRPMRSCACHGPGRRPVGACVARPDGSFVASTATASRAHARPRARQHDGSGCANGCVLTTLVPRRCCDAARAHGVEVVDDLSSCVSRITLEYRRTPERL